MDKLSDFDLLMILNCLDLNSRGRCACVSRRWRKLLLCRSSTRIDVLNMFDLNVWHQLSGNLKSRLGPQVLVQTKEELEGLLKLVRDVDVFKIWFDHEDFAESILTTAERLRVSGLDLYPYCDFVSLIPIKNVSSLQNTTRLTLRPHGKDKFWQGVTVAQLPGLPQLRTLRLESVFLLPTVCLPANITELEWKAPRGDNDELSKLLSKLVDDCVGLKYILLSHVDFKERKGNFDELMKQLARLPLLEVAAFKFCTFKYGCGTEFLRSLTKSNIPLCCGVTTSTSERIRVGPFECLRALRFDLCYDDIFSAINAFLEVAQGLKMIGLESICETPGLNFVYEVLPRLYRRDIQLKFGLIQRRSSSRASMGGCAVPPSVFSAVLSRFELSFIHDTRLIDEIFGLVTDKSSCFSHLTELRFIRCSGVTNLTLEQISRRCPRLCSLFLNGCVNVTSKGIAYLVTNWSCWQATNLTAIVCGTAISLQDFMAVKLWMETAIIVYHSCSYEGTRLKWRWTTKSLSGRKAHKVSVWENGKILSLQDYTANDVNEIIKVVVGFKPE